MGRPFRTQIRIRFADTDASGRIHYTAMFRHFEAAEQDYLHSAGHPYSGLEFSHLGFPRVHVECDFSAEIRYDDEVEMEMTVERVGASSYTLAYTVQNGGKPAARGRVTVVCMDRRTERSCAIPEGLAQALRSLLR